MDCHSFKHTPAYAITSKHAYMRTYILIRDDTLLLNIIFFVGQFAHVHAHTYTRGTVELTMMVKNMQITAMPTMEAQ